MNFNKHYDLEGKHAFLSPSKYTWVGYSKDQLTSSYANAAAAARGTKLHAIAKSLIEEGLKLRGSNQTLAAYVNDAIGYGMVPEQPLFYSPNCFGTTDAIKYRPQILRISDLKTGVSPVHMEQLEIYAALFFLEYGRALGADPRNTKTILKIYQNDDVDEAEPDGDHIEEIMHAIQEKDSWVEELKREVE